MDLNDRRCLARRQTAVERHNGYARIPIAGWRGSLARAISANYKHPIIEAPATASDQPIVTLWHTRNTFQISHRVLFILRPRRPRKRCHTSLPVSLWRGTHQQRPIRLRLVAGIPISLHFCRAPIAEYTARKLFPLLRISWPSNVNIRSANRDRISWFKISV